MKRFVFFAVSVLVFLTSCPVSEEGEDENSNKPLFASDLWGEWYAIETEGWGAVPYPSFYFTRNKIIQIRGNNIGGFYIDYDGKNGVEGRAEQVREIKRISGNVISLKIDRGQNPINSYLLYPKRIPSASFTGKIAAFEQSRAIQRAVAGGKGWVKVVVDDLNNGTTVTTTTDGEGIFIVNEVIPGDTYGVTAEGQTVEITPQADGDNIGTVTLSDGLNFKASIEPSKDIMLADGTKYSRKIQIRNIGTQTAIACNYQITPEGGAPVSGIIGTLAPGASATVDVSVNCSTINEEKIFKKYTIIVNDTINNKTWDDSVSFLFYKSTITLTAMSDFISSTSNYGVHNLVQGIIISPEKIGYFFETVTIATQNSSKTITLPRLKGNYLIAIVTSSKETVYGIDMSIFSTHLNESSFISQASSFIDTGRFEPNDIEGDAKQVSAPIIAYLHKGDVDYYIVTVN